MLKKRIGVAAIVLFMIGLYGFRVYVINTDVRLPVRQIFEKGEIVPYGKDFNLSAGDISDGYTVQVLDSKIMSAKDFCEEYNVKNMGLAKYQYMVKVSVENVSNPHIGEQGAPMGIAMLVGTNYSIIPSPDMFKAVNPDMPAQSFSLQMGTRKEIWLVFQVYKGNAPDYKDLEKDPPLMQITQYPHLKLLRLS